VPNLLRNLVLAARVLRRVRPLAVVTTGAGVAVPFVWLGRLLGVRVVYVETLARIDRPSLSYRLSAPFVTRTYVQWPELQQAIPDALFRGTVADRP
jgi:UDP-N-acetylglucosamine:LPS N-acetylglucosamine transferase